MFKYEEIIVKQSILGVVGKKFNLWEIDKPKYKIIILFMLLVFSIFFLVTFLENRFFLGSVTRKIENLGIIKGMSFIGDPMVWTYIFLVPLCLILTYKAARLTVGALEHLSFKIETNLGKDGLPDDYNETIKYVKKIFQASNNNVGKLIKFLPWILAISFWAYNTTTCIFYPTIGEKYYPYKSKNIIIVHTNINGEFIEKHISLNKDVMIPKWDTDIVNAPFSTIITRIWTLFFYTITPFLIVKLFQMAWGLTYFLNKFSKWVNILDKRVQVIEPFNEDGYGGFFSIAEVAMAYFYAAMAFIFLIMMSFFKEVSDPSFHDYMLLYLLVPISLLIFIWPLVYVRKIILERKNKYKKRISLEMNKLFIKIEIFDNSKKRTIEKSALFSELSALMVVYKQIHNLKEWPFSASMIFRIVIILFIPLSGVILDIIADFLLDK